MKNIYDNGSCLLGKVKNIIKYIESNEFDDEDLYNDLKEFYDENDIIFIDYDRGMGYGIDRFTEKDRIKTIEEIKEEEEIRKEKHEKLIEELYEKMKKYIMESDYQEIKRHYFWYGENTEICGREELLNIMFESYCNTYNDSELENEINKLEVK